MADPPGLARNRKLIARFAEILSSNDFATLEEVLHYDAVQDMPQSGERVRGLDNQRAVFANYPGAANSGFRAQSMEVIGEEPRYVMTPSFNLLHIEGTGDRGVAVIKSIYPDDSVWWVIVFFAVRGEKIARTTTYFAPAFPAPDWRTQWTEPI